MKSLAEGRDGVYRLLVIEAKNGVDTPGELGTNWEKEREICFLNKTLNRRCNTQQAGRIIIITHNKEVTKEGCHCAQHL